MELPGAVNDLDHFVKQKGVKVFRQADIRLCEICIQEEDWFAIEIRIEAFLPHQTPLLLAGLLRAGQTENFFSSFVSEKTV